MKKCFKAVGPAVVVKEWIEDTAKSPEGFHETISGALAAWKVPEVVEAPMYATDPEPPIFKRRGRPPKV